MGRNGGDSMKARYAREIRDGILLAREDVAAMARNGYTRISFKLPLLMAEAYERTVLGGEARRFAYHHVGFSSHIEGRKNKITLTRIRHDEDCW